MSGNRESLSRVCLLDNEIEKFLLENLELIVKEFPVGSKYFTELRYFLKVYLWFNSILIKGSSFGQDILSLKFKDKLTRRQLSIHFILNILGPYLREVGAVNFASNATIQKSLRYVDLLSAIFGLFNFFRFMKSGHAYNISEYFLDLQQVSLSSPRSIGYYYLNLELMWTGFIELLNVTVPLAKYYSNVLSSNQTTDDDESEIKRPKQIIPAEISSQSRCPLCNERLCIPFQSNCSHAFCYLCLASADIAFKCPVCKVVQSNGEISPVNLLTMSR